MREQRAAELPNKSSLPWQEQLDKHWTTVINAT